MQILDVLIQHTAYHLDRTFTYLYDGKETAKVGFRVIVNFNRQRIMGFVTKVRVVDASPEEIDKSFGFHVAFVECLYDKEPLLNDELLSLADEVASYYLSPKVSVLQAMLPSSLKPAISATNGPKVAYEDWLSLPEGLDIDLLKVTDKQRELLLLVQNLFLLLS